MRNIWIRFGKEQSKKIEYGFELKVIEMDPEDKKMLEKWEKRQRERSRLKSLKMGDDEAR